MFLNKIIPVMVCGLLLCLMVVSCERDLSTDVNSKVEPKAEQAPYVLEFEDDGIMKIVFAEYSYEKKEDGTGSYRKEVIVDSMFLSETEHELIINNAVPFTATPGNSLYIYFHGHFEGMEDAVCVWWNYSSDHKGYPVTKTMASYLTNNLGTVLVAANSGTIDPIQGYIFCMDTDLNNSGIGFVEIHHAEKIDTVRIDAAQNTVLQPAPVRVIDFDFADAYENYRLNVLITPADRFCTFKSIENHGILLFKELTNPRRKSCLEATSLLGGYTPTSRQTTLEITGFLPQFSIKEILNE